MKLSALFAIVACVVGAGTYFGATAFRGDAATTPMRAAQRDTTPTAAQFAHALAGATNQFGNGRSITNTHCAKGGPGDYMCSYAVVTAGGLECHLLHGEWTPGAASTITVVLSGRVGRCNSLRAAFHSLR